MPRRWRDPMFFWPSVLRRRISRWGNASLLLTSVAASRWNANCAPPVVTWGRGRCGVAPAAELPAGAGARLKWFVADLEHDNSRPAAPPSLSTFWGSGHGACSLLPSTYPRRGAPAHPLRAGSSVHARLRVTLASAARLSALRIVPARHAARPGLRCGSPCRRRVRPGLWRIAGAPARHVQLRVTCNLQPSPRPLTRLLLKRTLTPVQISAVFNRAARDALAAPAPPARRCVLTRPAGAPGQARVDHSPSARRATSIRLTFGEDP